LYVDCTAANATSARSVRWRFTSGRNRSTRSIALPVKASAICRRLRSSGARANSSSSVGGTLRGVKRSIRLAGYLQNAISRTNPTIARAPKCRST
jgi:hypothetical protein